MSVVVILLGIVIVAVGVIMSVVVVSVAFIGLAFLVWILLGQLGALEPVGDAAGEMVLRFMRGEGKRHGALQVIVGQRCCKLRERFDKHRSLFRQLLRPDDGGKQGHKALDLSGIARHDALPFMQTLMQCMNVDLIQQIDGRDGVKDGIRQTLSGYFVLIHIQFCDPTFKAGDARGQRFEAGGFLLLARCVAIVRQRCGQPGIRKVEHDGCGNEQK